MRPNQQNNKNRQRGRNNGGRKHINPLSRNYESNGPDVKVRGNASHVAEKYLQLARDAQSSGDSVMAENYLQHAEHYFRIVQAAQPQQFQRPDQVGQEPQTEDEDDDFPPIHDRFASPEPRANGYAQPNGNGYSQAEGGQTASQPQAQAQPATEGESGESTPAQAASTEGGDGQPGAQGEGGEGGPRRHRDRRPRRRNRGDGGQGNVDPANAPQPEVGELPAFLTAGTTPTAAE